MDLMLVSAGIAIDGNNNVIPTLEIANIRTELARTLR